jgi:hypothetical protein
LSQQFEWIVAEKVIFLVEPLNFIARKENSRIFYLKTEERCCGSEYSMGREKKERYNTISHSTVQASY